MAYWLKDMKFILSEFTGRDQCFFVSVPGSAAKIQID